MKIKTNPKIGIVCFIDIVLKEKNTDNYILFDIKTSMRGWNDNKKKDFGSKDPPTPKERPVLNAGQFIDNDTVKGYVNRIEGKDVYVESLEEPMVIKKFSLKDAVKIKKEK